MREIKFRVPIECNACKFKGFQYFEWNGQSFTPNGYDKCECEKLEVVGEIQQFTGLKDKNGKDIYEGDIVKYRTHPMKTSKGIVVWSKNEPALKILDDHIYYSLGSINMIEIIGNIFENPELINQPLT